LNTRALKEAQRRIKWLEDELSRQVGADCRATSTGTPVQNRRPISSQSDAAQHREEPSGSATDGQLGPASSNNEEAPDIGLLALNATGESRYLGPSSGAMFANYAIALVQSSGLSNQPERNRRPHSSTMNDNVTGANLHEEHQPLPPDEVQLLLGSYRMWVHPLYPLLDIESLERLVATCGTSQTSDATETQEQDMSLFYLVMALGAANRANTIKQLQLEPANYKPSDKTASSSFLFSMASQRLYLNAEGIRPSIMFIRTILLICIYSFYEPIGSSQWQLAGMAMRVRQHRQSINDILR
jgi:hypothetical protein